MTKEDVHVKTGSRWKRGVKDTKSVRSLNIQKDARCARDREAGVKWFTGGSML